MIRPLALLLACAALAGCASKPSHPDAFTFGVLGDTPYSAKEEEAFLGMIARMNREPLAFAIHIGDITTGAGPCTDELYARRRAQFDTFAFPLVYTPGDNDWTDCRRGKPPINDPIERLAKLRAVFFADRRAMGAGRLEMLAQDRCPDDACRCPPHPENRFWMRGGVRFVTLNIPGSDNNVGFDAASDAEAACRDEANAAWLEQAVRASERSETRALVIAIQADPWDTAKPVYHPFLRQVADAAKRVRKPVLLIHGDSHVQRVDTPFRDAFGNPVLAITRLETYGSPFVGWVEVTVDPEDPEVFTFHPHLHALVK